MEQRPTSITSRALVLCEGRDEVGLLDAMAAHMGIDVQCVDCGGSRQFGSRIKAVVRMPGFSSVVALAVVRDAESDGRAAAQSVRSHLASQGLAAPSGPLELARTPHGPATAFLVVPSADASGMLEDLVLRMMADLDSWPCQEAYFECLQARGADLDRHLSKRRVQAGLAAIPGRVVPRSIGEAAQQGGLGLDHAAFADVRRLLELVTTSTAA